MRFLRPRTSGTVRGHAHYIRLKLRDVHQLFNSMDPSPFIEKDLDADAEEFILSWAQEFPADDAIRLHIYLEQWPVEDPKEPVKTAVHNYFAHRAEIQKAIEKGSVITADQGLRALARVASKNPKYNQAIFPYLIDHLKSCRPKDVAQRSESTLPAVNTTNRDAFVRVLEKRMEDLSTSGRDRVRKVIKRA